MKLKQIAANQTLLSLDGPDHVTVFFSYSTPVAAFGLSPQWHEKFGNAYIRTAQRFSATTNRHILKFLDGAKGVEVEQSVLEGLLS